MESLETRTKYFTQNDTLFCLSNSSDWDALNYQTDGEDIDTKF
jgi:hypothetical protein